MKYCPQCQENKDESLFSKDKKTKSGLCSWCKACQARKVREYRQQPHVKESLRQYRKQYQQNPNKRSKLLSNLKNNRYLRDYGITSNDKVKMMALQDWKCAICGQRINSSQECCVDHDHVSKKVRNILCHKCNKGLGHFQDNPDFLRRAAGYLDYHRSQI
jgi:hypothetical protein